ncbi:Regulator of RNase E activity RraA [Parapedobacter luteus]|uniref:Regulator of RNase E activity RraA n=1 Tax=Parapedobacter luteus TaxID=623280 RepID=A0A1T5FIC1_9SPHI|nr:dimethylmenaquinone methyltransferase [Parapedobacter luteus]SKB95905.1 Regulator of RNase E activity RraA [Parapedobacter luteus]
MKTTIIYLLFLFSAVRVAGQEVAPSRETIIGLTPLWKGDRFPDGRPKVPDELLERLKKVSIEEAWGGLRAKGYHNQFEADWMIVNPDEVMTGRAVTAQYMPSRPDVDSTLRAIGIKEGRNSAGGTNSWPIDVLQDGDIYVADGYGKIVDGTLIGDILANAIYTNSKRGVIFYGSVRDLKGIREVEGFNGWVKGYDPSFIQQMMLTSINTPIRIGRATVMPGDAVLANQYGTVFIPAHLLHEIVLNAEFIMLRDEFGKQRIKEKKYTAGDVDSRWTAPIREDFLGWLREKKDLPMSREELDNYMKQRNW